MASCNECGQVCTARLSREQFNTLAVDLRRALERDGDFAVIAFHFNDQFVVIQSWEDNKVFVKCSACLDAEAQPQEPPA